MPIRIILNDIKIEPYSSVDFKNNPEFSFGQCIACDIKNIEKYPCLITLPVERKIPTSTNIIQTRNVV